METIKSEKRWCVWSYGIAKRRKTKIPYCDVKKWGSCSDKSRWLDYPTAQKLLKQNPSIFHGMGLYLSRRENNKGLVLCAIDIDAHNSSANENPLSAQIIALFSRTYIEKSPSKRGYHILFDADISKIRLTQDNKIDYQVKNESKQLEVYVGETTNKYMTYTENIVSQHTEIVDMTEQLIVFLEKYMKKQATQKKKTSTPVSLHMEPFNYVPQHEINIEERLDIARRSKYGAQFTALFDAGDTSKENGDMSKASYHLVRQLCFWLEGDIALIDRAFRMSKLMRDKWDEKRGATTWGGMTIQKALQTCDHFYVAPQKATNTPASITDWFHQIGLGYTSATNAGKDISASTGQNISPDDVLQLINSFADDSNQQTNITVLPLMCGTGKSTAIRLKIRQVIEENTGSGMIIITDNIDRMRDYLMPSDDQFKQFFLDFNDKICLITSESTKDQIAAHHRCPVLLMTTQRYIDLSREHLDEFYRWDYGTRNLLLVDERPYFKTTKTVTLKDISNVGAAIKMGLPDMDKHGDPVSEKAWLIDQWGVLERYITGCFMRIDEKYSDGKQYYFSSKTNWSDWELFGKLLQTFKEYRTYLNTAGGNYDNVYATVIALFQAMSGDGILSHRTTSNGQNITQYDVLFDHYDNYCDLPAKVIILDGTADLSYEYQLYDDVEIINCDQYKRSLERMTIHLIDKSTGRTQFAKSKNEQAALIDQINEILSGLLPQGTKPVVFSYMSLESKLATIYGRNSVDYFGKIRGTNDYRNAEHIVQIGLNRWPQICYFLYELATDNALKESLITIPEQESTNIILQHIRQPNSVTQEAMNRELLAELEQNIFRGVIRCANEQTQYHFYLFTSLTNYKALISMMVQRYRPLHCQFADPVITKVTKTWAEYMDSHKDDDIDKQPNAYKIGLWHDQQITSGTIYTYADITKATGLTTKQINKAREKNTLLDKLFGMQDKWATRPIQFRKTREWSDTIIDPDMDFIF